MYTYKTKNWHLFCTGVKKKKKYNLIFLVLDENTHDTYVVNTIIYIAHFYKYMDFVIIKT